MSVLASHTPRILLVDDDPGLRQALEFRLGIEGFVVNSFESGEAVIQESAFPEWGCLVLDWRLPGFDGLQTLQRLRQRNVQLPAILITSNPGSDLQAAAAAAGVPVVEKPLLTNELELQIERLLAPQEDRE